MKSIRVEKIAAKKSAKPGIRPMTESRWGLSATPPSYGIRFLDSARKGAANSRPARTPGLTATVPNQIQPKLAIGASGNVYEREADRVADQVMTMNEPVAAAGGTGRSATRIKDRERPHIPGVSTSAAVNRTMNAPISVTRTNQPLSRQEREYFEPRFGRDLSHVRIHADQRSAEMADALNAEAFTVGNSIYFGPKKLEPQNRASQQLLAHELVHVTQQSRMGPALQPKLKITGKAADISRTIALLNGGLFGFEVSIDKSGNVTVARNSIIGPPTAQQQALQERLSNIIDDPKDVIMTVSAGSKTLVGSYATGDFDISDVEAIGVHALIHEMEEQHQKQVKGMAYGSETTGAHGEGIKAESEVMGAKRGPQKITSSSQNPDGTLNAVAEVPYTFPDGKVKTMVMTITSNNVTSVTWK
ncbi:MAG TPA: DUF4157 domain-containing protein [Terriglobales bacterium]